MPGWQRRTTPKRSRTGSAGLPVRPHRWGRVQSQQRRSFAGHTWKVVSQTDGKRRIRGASVTQSLYNYTHVTWDWSRAAFAAVKGALQGGRSSGHWCDGGENQDARSSYGSSPTLETGEQIRCSIEISKSEMNSAQIYHGARHATLSARATHQHASV